MAFTITHLFGEMEPSPAPAALGGLLDELTAAEDEHPNVSVSHESGWTAGVYRSGRVIFEQVEEGEDDGGGPRHVDGLSREEILALLAAVAAGRLDDVEALDWLDGY